MRLPKLDELSLAESGLHLSAHVGWLAKTLGLPPHTPFPLFYSSPGIPIPPEMTGPDHGYHLSAGVHWLKPKPSSSLVACEFGSAIAAISQRPRRQCQVLTQWKLQALEAAAVRGRVVPRLRRHTHATFLRALEHLVPQTLPGPPDHGRTVPTSRHSALAVVPEKAKE